MPRDTATGQMVEGAEAQADLTLQYALDVARAAGATPADVTLVFVYMTDLKWKAAVNHAFAKHFGDHPPARNFVEVSAIGEDALVEVSLIAVAP
jgi:2-iminobutanoate/2-iminopropanoate deaminase